MGALWLKSFQGFNFLSVMVVLGLLIGSRDQKIMGLCLIKFSNAFMPPSITTIHKRHSSQIIGVGESQFHLSFGGWIDWISEIMFGANHILFYLIFLFFDMWNCEYWYREKNKNKKTKPEGTSWPMHSKVEEQGKGDRVKVP